MTFQGVPLQAYPTLEQLEALEQVLRTFERRHCVRVTFSTTIALADGGPRRAFRLDVNGWCLEPDRRSLEELTTLLEQHGVATLTRAPLGRAASQPAEPARTAVPGAQPAGSAARWKLRLPRFLRAQTPA